MNVYYKNRVVINWLLCYFKVLFYKFREKFCNVESGIVCWCRYIVILVFYLVFGDFSILSNLWIFLGLVKYIFIIRVEVDWMFY